MIDSCGSSPRAARSLIGLPSVVWRPRMPAIINQARHRRCPPPSRPLAPASGTHMLALVRIALHRPYTFIVAGLLIFLIGTLAALRTPVDIFPSINIPIIGVAFQYQGLPPDQMAEIGRASCRERV